MPVTGCLSIIAAWFHRVIATRARLRAVRQPPDSVMTDIQHIHDFLPCATPRAWIDWALQHPDILLIDHAHCEKKAASTALNLMFRYTERTDLLQKMSRLAREELRHFEQVLKFMIDRDVRYVHLTASRYAEGMRRHVLLDGFWKIPSPRKL